jgi:hypothetical protein
VTLRRLACVPAVLVLAACQSGDDDGAAKKVAPKPPPPPARFATVDERVGAYGPLQFGDPVARARQLLGPKRPATIAERHTPTGSRVRFRGPTTLNLQDAAAAKLSRQLTLRHPDVALYFLDRRLAAFMLTSPRARTRRGVGIGTRLARAKRLYPELRCGFAGGSEPSVGYPACTGRIRDGMYVWFGADPIENITISIRPPTGV